MTRIPMYYDISILIGNRSTWWQDKGSLNRVSQGVIVISKFYQALLAPSFLVELKAESRVRDVFGVWQNHHNIP